MNIWVVLDENGHPEYSASWPEACHEHIRDIQDQGPEEAEMAAKWVVREYAPVSPSTVTDKPT